MTHKHSKLIGSIVLLTSLSLASCGTIKPLPKLNPPNPANAMRYPSGQPVISTTSVNTALGEAQTFATDLELSAKWWEELGSVKLNTLIESALKSSPTLASATATLRQAQAIYDQQNAVLTGPQISANTGVQTLRTSPSGLGQEGDARNFELYNANIKVAYQFDLSGANKTALEALTARTNYRQFQLNGARLTLAGNIATSAITQAKLNEQLAIVHKIIISQERQLSITQQRVRLGNASMDAVNAIQSQLELSKSQIPVYRQQIQQSEHLLAVLTGRAPSEGTSHNFNFTDFSLPRKLPLLLPSELIRRRPDIQAAEALMHAANAEYGVAAAKAYPQLTLSSNLGLQALTIGSLFDANSVIWSLAGQLSQPLFSKSVPAEKRAAMAAFDVSAANYQIIVLEAFRNVADIMRAVENDAQKLSSLSQANLASQKTLASLRRQYQHGTISYLQLIIAEEQYEQSQIALINAQSQRLINTAAFFQAMGGGLSQIEH